VVTEVTSALVDAERRHKHAGFNTQCVSKLVDVQKRDVPLPPLDRTHVSAVDASPGGKGLLRKADLSPLNSDLPPERDQHLIAHDCSTIRAMMPMCLQTISSNWVHSGTWMSLFRSRRIPIPPLIGR
jgi:hypothetical protein